MNKLLPSAGNVFTHHIPMCHAMYPERLDRAAVGTGGVVGCYRAIVGCCLGGWGVGVWWVFFYWKMNWIFNKIQIGLRVMLIFLNRL